MSDLAYFEYKTIIPPQGSEREGTPAHYLVDVLIKHPVTGEKREEAELKKLANEHLTLVLNLGVVQLPELKPISESEAKKLNMVRSLGARSDSGVFWSSKSRYQTCGISSGTDLPVVNAPDAIFVKTTGKGLTLPLHIKMELGPFLPVCRHYGTRRFSPVEGYHSRFDLSLRQFRGFYV